MPKRISSGRAGFTLSELLVVIGILTVLIGLLVFGISSVRQRSLLVKCASNLRQIGAALEMYDQTFRHLPTALAPEALISLKASVAEGFLCPAQDPAPKGSSSYQLSARIAGKPLGVAKPDEILAEEFGESPNGPSRHGGKRNILYVDGHVAAQTARKG